MLRVEGPAAIEIQHLSNVILERVNRFFGWQAIGRIALRQAPLRRRERKAVRKPDPEAAARASPRRSPRSQTRICGPRWRGSGRQSSRN